MVDELKKDIVPDADENSWDNSENLNENLDNFSDELSDLEETIRDVAWDKIEEREQKIVSDTSSELDSLNAEVNLDWLDKKDNKKSIDRVSEFFWKWKEEFKKIDTFNEKKVVKKYWKTKNNLKYRPEKVKEAIEWSADEILDEIYNWRKEKNPVARSLLRIVNWIMKTEK